MKKLVLLSVLFFPASGFSDELTPIETCILLKNEITSSTIYVNSLQSSLRMMSYSTPQDHEGTSMNDQSYINKVQKEFSDTNEQITKIETSKNLAQNLYRANNCSEYFAELEKKLTPKK